MILSCFSDFYNGNTPSTYKGKAAYINPLQTSHWQRFYTLGPWAILFVEAFSPLAGARLILLKSCIRRSLCTGLPFLSCFFNFLNLISYIFPVNWKSHLLPVDHSCWTLSNYLFARLQLCSYMLTRLNNCRCDWDNVA